MEGFTSEVIFTESAQHLYSVPGEVHQFSLRTVLFVVVQYCIMWMGNVYCCNSRSVKWTETFECLLWITNGTRNLWFLGKSFSMKFRSTSRLWSYCLNLLAQVYATVHSPRMRNLLLFLKRAIGEDVAWNPICIITNSLLVDIYAQSFTSFIHWFYSMTQPGQLMQMIIQWIVSMGKDTLCCIWHKVG